MLCPQFLGCICPVLSPHWMVTLLLRCGEGKPKKTLELRNLDAFSNLLFIVHSDKTICTVKKSGKSDYNDFPMIKLVHASPRTMSCKSSSCTCKENTLANNWCCATPANTTSLTNNTFADKTHSSDNKGQNHNKCWNHIIRMQQNISFLCWVSSLQLFSDFWGIAQEKEAFQEVWCVPAPTKALHSLPLSLAPNLVVWVTRT